MDLKLFEERLGILRAELLDEVVRFASVTGDVSEDESDALTAMTPRYLRTAWELVQGITSADAALVVYDRLHDLEADLMKDAPMHFGCISVTRGVLAAEATYRQDSADPAYTHANSLMFDALVRPNWCYNKLVITGTGCADVRAFLNKHGEAAHIPASQRFCYDWIVPEPREKAQPPAPPKPSSDPIRDQIAAAQTVDELRAALTHLTPEPAPPAHDWYTWRVDRWGCKWDTSGVQVYDTEDAITIRWESPWSPPRKVIRAFADQFQTAEFTHTFGEPGCDFGGHDFYEDGVCVESEDTDFKATEWFDPADYPDDDADEE